MAEHPVPEAILCTRFSFYGKSGWKSLSSQTPELLFARERLEARLATFETITLASLRAQSRQDFHHYVLTSATLPDWAKTRLRDLCLAAHGEESRFTLHEAKFAPSRNHLRRFLEARHGTGLTVQIVLDDDDGLAGDFLEDLRPHLSAMLADLAEAKLTVPRFVTYPFGYGLVLRDGLAELYAHRYRYINLGLTLVSPANDKNIFAINHRKAPRRFGAEIIRKPGMFLRSVHDFNDSRVDIGEGWQKVENWPEDAELLARFPTLAALAAEGAAG